MEEKAQRSKILEVETIRQYKRKIILTSTLTLAFLCLASGGFIYICFRPDSLIMFNWINNIGLSDAISALRNKISFHLPHWVIYALPDGLWVYSYVIFMSWIWKFDIRKGIVFILAIPIIGIVSEFAQQFGIIPGVFDWADLICYSVGTAVGIFTVIMIENKLKQIDK